MAFTGIKVQFLLWLYNGILEYILGIAMIISFMTCLF